MSFDERRSTLRMSAAATASPMRSNATTSSTMRNDRDGGITIGFILG